MSDNPFTPMTDDELEALSEITEADIQAAVDQWQKDAPAEYKKLLEAETIKDDDAPIP